MAQPFANDWLIPEWPAPRNVRAVFTTRSGGVSRPPHDSMNLGAHVGDAPDCVASNRQLLQRSTGVRTVFLNQVHGCDVVTLSGEELNGLQADACLTTQRRLACTIMVADCLPILLTTEEGGVVAAAHAGWRGLAGRVGQGGVLDTLCASFRPLAQQIQAQHAIKKIAWLGPCIGPLAFEVGNEVKAGFEAVQPAASACFVSLGAGKFLANLPALARLRLQALGLAPAQIYGNDGSAPWCTVRNSSRFFSHRRDAGASGNGLGTTGRMAAAIWLD